MMRESDRERSGVGDREREGERLYTTDRGREVWNWDWSLLDVM